MFIKKKIIVLLKELNCYINLKFGITKFDTLFNFNQMLALTLRKTVDLEFLKSVQNLQDVT